MFYLLTSKLPKKLVFAILDQMAASGKEIKESWKANCLNDLFLIYAENAMDIFEKCAKFTAAKEAIAAGYYPYFIPLTENEGPKPFSVDAASSCADRTTILD